MPSLPRRNLLLGLGIAAVAATGGSARAVWAFGAVAPAAEDIALPPAVHPLLFGTRESPMDALLSLMPKAAVLVRSLAARAIPASAGGSGGGGSAALRRWTAVLAALRGAEPMTQLVTVNHVVNTVPYVSDRRNYHVPDYWATPEEFFAAGGDCEDFALAKFVSLHRLGFNEDRLRIVIVLDQRRQLQHAILAVYLADDIYVLDNQIEAVTPHRRISHYRPICSFNSRRLWIHAA